MDPEHGRAIAAAIRQPPPRTCPYCGYVFGARYPRNPDRPAPTIGNGALQDPIAEWVAGRQGHASSATTYKIVKKVSDTA